jgi:hypothetical protein
MAEANTPAYYDTVTITNLESFGVLASKASVLDL